MSIDFVYKCLLGDMDERDVKIRCINLDNYECCSKIKVRTEAEHSIAITVRFLRQKNLYDCCVVSFCCNAYGEERLSLDESEKKVCFNEEKNCNSSESPVYPGKLVIEEVELPLIILGDCIISSGVNIPIYHDLITECSDFIIKTK